MTTVFIISAPSGAGKSTLVKRQLDRDAGLLFSISDTTRPPRRPDESYHHISFQEFDALLQQNAFLEHSVIYGNCYGTPRRFYEQALAERKDLILDIDFEGTLQVRKKIPDTVSIFIVPPSPKILESRLRARGEDSDAEIKRRLRKAADEMSHVTEYDYVVVNHKIEDADRDLSAILNAERLRVPRVREQIEGMLDAFREGSNAALVARGPDERK